MAFASHLGPWLLGTVKNTTGTTAGQIRNMGATTVIQSVPLVASSAVQLVIPAGSLILNAYTYMSTGAVGTPALYVNGTSAGTISTAAGINSLASPVIATLLNVGSTDAVVTYTATAASAGTLVIEYAVRNSDGSANPASV